MVRLSISFLWHAISSCFDRSPPPVAPVNRNLQSQEQSLYISSSCYIARTVWSAQLIQSSTSPAATLFFIALHLSDLVLFITPSWPHKAHRSRLSLLHSSYTLVCMQTRYSIKSKNLCACQEKAFKRLFTTKVFKLLLLKILRPAKKTK